MMSSTAGSCILLMYLEDPQEWDEQTLLSAIQDIIDTVNSAQDITGFSTAGLYAGQWGDDAIISFFVDHDERYVGGENDQMIIDTFDKALELCDLEGEMWVVLPEDKVLLDPDEP